MRRQIPVRHDIDTFAHLRITAVPQQQPACRGYVRGLGFLPGPHTRTGRCLLDSLDVYQGAAITRLAMKLMAMAFVRTTELIGARWSEFDFEVARWDIPAERMKMKSPHLVPLSVPEKKF